MVTEKEGNGDGAKIVSKFSMHEFPRMPPQFFYENYNLISFSIFLQKDQGGLKT